MKLSEEVLLQARALISTRLGLNFSDSRQSDLERGLLQALRISSVPVPEQYFISLAALPAEHLEWRRLAGYLTVGETYFFRDQACFEALERQVLPELIAIKRKSGLRQLRIWSAACATGEEAYSLAILLKRMLPDLADWSLTILATDINPESLETAKRAVYREWSLRETPPWARDQYFEREGAEAYRLDPKIQRMVTIAPLNLAEDGFPALVTNTKAMDLILCRNVLMYFTPDMQRATVDRLQRALVIGGWLIVSSVEASRELLHPLTPVNFPGAIFYQKKVGQAGPAERRPVGQDAWTPRNNQAVHPINQPESENATSVPAPALLHRDFQKLEVEKPVPSTCDMAETFQQSRALADQGQLDEAQRVCEAALAQNRLSAEGHMLLAAIAQEKGEITGAMTALRRAIYLTPNSTAAHFHLGSLLLQQGQQKQGRRCMETVVHLLKGVHHDEIVEGGDGLTAGRLREMATIYLETARL
jgi:chemotaxis protein methyltransferase CheR